MRNTVTGLREVDPAVVKAATGMGMGRLALLWHIELSLAYLVILAGVRVATALIVGIGAIAAYVAGPGLGAEMFSALRWRSRSGVSAVLIDDLQDKLAHLSAGLRPPTRR